MANSEIVSGDQSGLDKTAAFPSFVEESEAKVMISEALEERLKALDTTVFNNVKGEGLEVEEEEKHHEKDPTKHGTFNYYKDRKESHYNLIQLLDKKIKTMKDSFRNLVKDFSGW